MTDHKHRNPPAAASSSDATATPRREGAGEAGHFGAASPNRWSWAQLVACAERELRYRRRVYPRLIDSGKLSVAMAEREISQMEAIQSHLAKLAGAECPKLL